MFSIFEPFNNRGEIEELRQQLQSGRGNLQIKAMGRILAKLIQGVPMDDIFTEVLKCSQTENIQVKKLIFYYLSETSTRHPDLAMLTVNTFWRDLKSPQPKIRAMALKTASKMPDLWEHLTQNLQECMKDEDPYVRKTAALCVAKFHRKRPNWVEEMGFVSNLEGMLQDGDECVVVNAVSALMEIGEFHIDMVFVNRILGLLERCHEWGRIILLQATTLYHPTPTESKAICEKVTPYLNATNTGVVFAATKVIIPLLDNVQKETRLKLAKSLKSLPNEPALQYVALRKIQLVLKKFPDLLGTDVRPFFVHYTDPIFVKLAKLEVIVMMACGENMLRVVREIEEYVKEADVEFGRAAVLAIGRCAMKDSKTADLCVRSLLRVVKSGVSHVVEESMVAFRDVFRRYPKRYERAINEFNDRLEVIEDPEARSAFIWMLGEFAAHINENPLNNFLENFPDEEPTVQLTLLTATVKAFLREKVSQEIVLRVLSKATEVSNPDLRDRAIIYWRLLSTDGGMARAVVLAEKPPICLPEENLPERFVAFC